MVTKRQVSRALKVIAGRPESVLESQIGLLAAQFSGLVLGFVLIAYVHGVLDGRDFGRWVLALTILQLGLRIVDGGLQPTVIGAVIGGSTSGGIDSAVWRWRWRTALIAASAVAVLGQLPFVPRFSNVVLAAVSAAILVSPWRTSQAHLVAARRNAFLGLTGLLCQLANLTAVLIAGRIAGERLLDWVILCSASREILISLAAPLATGVWSGSRMLRLSLRPLWGAIGAAVCSALYFHIDMWLVDHFLGIVDVAVYGLAIRLVQPLFTAATLFVAPIAIAHVEFDDRARDALPRLFALMIGVFLSIAAALPHGLDVLESLGWLKVGPARPIIAVVAASAVFVSLSSFASLVLLAHEKIRSWFVTTVIGLSLNIVANAVLLPRCGIMGAAWTTLATEATVAICAVGFLLGKRYAWRALGGYALLAATPVLIGGLALRVFFEGGLQRAIASCLAATAWCALLVFGPFGTRARAPFEVSSDRRSPASRPR